MRGTDRYAIRERISKEYDREPAGLLRMTLAVSGHKMIEEMGEEQANVDADSVEDGVYVALFDNGKGIMVDYSGGSPGYSEYTPGWPGTVTYYLLTRKARP